MLHQGLLVHEVALAPLAFGSFAGYDIHITYNVRRKRVRDNDGLASEMTFAGSGAVVVHANCRPKSTEARQETRKGSTLLVVAHVEAAGQIAWSNGFFRNLPTALKAGQRILVWLEPDVSRRSAGTLNQQAIFSVR